MRYVGLNDCRHSWHDAGIAVFNESGDLIFYSQRERITRKKRDPWIGDVNEQLTQAGLEPLGSNDQIFVCTPDVSIDGLTGLTSQKKSTNTDLIIPMSEISKEYNFFFVSHHLSHAASSWMYRTDDLKENEEALYLAFDGWGFRTDLQIGFYSVGFIGRNKLIELENSKLDPKHYMPDERINFLPLPYSNKFDVAGKLMGLAGYFPNAEIKKQSDFDLDAIKKKYYRPNGFRFLTRLILRMFGINKGYVGYSLMVTYASIYKTYISDVKNVLGKYLDKYPNKTVVVGGGTFLALELNNYIKERGRNVIFSPAINDTGMCLGIAALGYFLLKNKWPKQIQTPYIQWQPEEDRSGGYVDPKTAAKMLYEGEIIGLITGKGEAGPRALGNRSLLARPSLETMRKVSVDIKSREFYRPVAPIVTDRDFDSLFTGPKGKYMQFRNECTEKAKKLAPGIVHRDGSARAQVLEEKDNPWLYQTLVEFGKLSGVECLINTSLNCGGKPICNTVADAKKEFAGKPVKLVYF